LITVWEILLAVVRNVQSLRKSALYDKRDDFTFPIVDFLFISNNITASPAYVVYILHFIRYSRACAQYSDFLDRAQLLTQKLLEQGYVAPRLKSLLQNYMVIITIWVTVMKYPYLKGQWIFYYM
jgi:predicted O-linked N-acetylglucosamine transferase (SPINDLY family)